VAIPIHHDPAQPEASLGLPMWKRQEDEAVLPKKDQRYEIEDSGRDGTHQLYTP